MSTSQCAPAARPRRFERRDLEDPSRCAPRRPRARTLVPPARPRYRADMCPFATRPASTPRPVGPSRRRPLSAHEPASRLQTKWKTRGLRCSPRQARARMHGRLRPDDSPQAPDVRAQLRQTVTPRRRSRLRARDGLRRCLRQPPTAWPRVRARARFVPTPPSRFRPCGPRSPPLQPRWRDPRPAPGRDLQRVRPRRSPATPTWLPRHSRSLP